MLVLNDKESYIFITRLASNEILQLVDKNIIVSDKYKDLYVNIRQQLKPSELQQMKLNEYQKIINKVIIDDDQTYSVEELTRLLKKIRVNKLKK